MYLGVCRVYLHVLTYIHILALLSDCSCTVFFFVFLSIFFVFLSISPQRCCHHHWWAQLWPVVSPSWSQLALTQTQVKLLAASHRSHTCSPLLPKPCHTKAVQCVHLGAIFYRFFFPSSLDGLSWSIKNCKRSQVGVIHMQELLTRKSYVFLFFSPGKEKE